MKWSSSLIPTSKENPAEATTVGHQLLVRAGMVRQVAAGLFDWLPLGARVAGKIEDIFAREFEAAGGIGVRVSALQPADPRPQAEFGVKDRRGRTLALSSSGAGAMVRLAAGSVRSHRQMPTTLFRIGASFRDEERPRRGLIDSREYTAAEACAVAADAGGIEKASGVLRQAVERALGRCGVPFETVGSAGGCEFFTRCAAGDDVVVVASDDGAYISTLAEAQTGSRPWTFGGDPAGELEVVPTPGVSTVGDVARFLRVREADVLKTMVFRATPSGEWTGYETPENLTTPLWVLAVVRGDHDVNAGKLAAVVREEFHITSIALATEGDAGEFAFGYVGPDAAIRKVRAALVVDPDAAQDRAWVAGANEPGHHVRNFNWFRECGQPLADPRKVAVADIRNVVDGDPAPGRDGGSLQLVPGITLGRIAPLPPAGGDTAITFQDDSGAQRVASVNICEVNLSRLLAAAAETGHDDRGIVWPNGMAPYSVVLTPIQYGGATKEAVDRIYGDLLAAGIDVLLDDRDLRPGTKFADADLIGFPVRVNVGERGLQKGVVELKRRTAAEAVEVEIGRVVDAVLGR